MKKILLITIVAFLAVTLFAKDKESDKNSKGGLKSAGLMPPPSISTGQTSSDFYSSSDVSYTWKDISGTGTEVTLDGSDDDDYYGSFPIGFSFPFYENSHTQFYFDTNGGIYFEDDELSYDYTHIPGVGNDDGLVEFIAWHWADLEMDDDDGSKVYYQTFTGYTIIQFVDYQDHDDTDYYATAQVVLYENGNIEIRYKSLDSNYFDKNFAIGIQKDETEGLEVAYEYEDGGENSQAALVSEAGGLKSASAGSGFFDNLPKSILIVNKANAEPVPFSIYSVLALFALIGGVTVFKLRKRIFNIA